MRALMLFACLQLIIPLFTVLPNAKAAENYYVDPSGTNATSAGTLQNPFRTIQYALNQVNAGDTVYVKAGVYNEKVTFPESGSPGAYITLKIMVPISQSSMEPGLVCQMIMSVLY